MAEYEVTYEQNMREQPGDPMDVENAPTKKELGAFYTPNTLTAALAKWAIRSSDENILEPSFGGCGFLESAVVRLKDLGCITPQNQLYGCDIDPVAFSHLHTVLGVVDITQRYLKKDFLTVQPSDFLRQEFDAVIGNPPYISHHNMPPHLKDSIQAWRTANKDLPINGRASLWAYFVMHALSFLKPGGRMAWVLPGSFLQANYGAALQKNLLSRFGHVAAISIGERVFLTEGTEERTVVLLGTEFGQSTEEIIFRHCHSLVELEEELKNGANLTYPAHSILHPSANPDTFLKIAARDDVVELGSLGQIRIGTVTGANSFFIISQSKAKELGLDESYLTPILSKFGHIKGTQVTAEDLSKWQHKDKKCLLFQAAGKELSESAKQYIDTFPEEKRSSNSTFSRRQDWLAAEDGRIPDAFFSYMSHSGPKIALNNARLNCTNSIHRIYFSNEIEDHIRKLVVISLCTSFSQLSAEKEGRNYGSGVLKIEPSEAKKIKLVIPKDKSREDIDQTFGQLDGSLRSGNLLEAQQIADRFILGGSQEIINPLGIQLKDLRKQRMR